MSAPAPLFLVGSSLGIYKISPADQISHPTNWASVTNGTETYGEVTTILYNSAGSSYYMALCDGTSAGGGGGPFSVSINLSINSTGPGYGYLGDGEGYYDGGGNGGSSCGSITGTAYGNEISSIGFADTGGNGTIVVAITGTLPQNYFSSFSFTDNDSIVRTYNTVSATFTRYGSYTVWAWASATSYPFGFSGSKTINFSNNPIWFVQSNDGITWTNATPSGLTTQTFKVLDFAGDTAFWTADNTGQFWKWTGSSWTAESKPGSNGIYTLSSVNGGLALDSQTLNVGYYTRSGTTWTYVGDL